MPGNEAVDRLHNFFGQENLSQGQYQSQAVDGNWPGLSNNIWVGSQRSTGVPFISNLKNFNQQQCDSEQGHVSSPYFRHSLNLSQSNLRHESGRNQLPNQQAAVSGYMQGQQVFQTRQNGANILEMDTESDWHHVSRGIPVLESQGSSGLELYKKNLARNGVGESPVNFDFFGGQQLVSGRHNGMLQPLPRQHSGIDEMHLLQQQAVLNKMQELQRQQQFHQPEAKQQNSMAPAVSISKQKVTSHSAPLINGIAVNEASNFMWQPEVMATNANWLQRGASPVMHGSSNGLMLSPEQGQALHTMGLVHNQGDQSLYGVPVSGSGGTPNLYYHTQEDKPAMQQVSFPQQYSHVHGNKPVLPHIVAGSNSFPAHQNAAFSDYINRNDGTLVSRQDIQGKSVFGATARVNSGLNVENLQQVNSELRIVPMQDFHGRQELAGSSEMSSQDKMLVQAPPSQNIATLNPTEEKILFGSDDSLWDGFGTNTDFNMLDGTDSSSGFLSLQSGSWSALMQSAVAEISSSDMGIQEEWSGLGLQNMGRSSGNEQHSTTGGSKQQSVCGDNNLQSSSNKNSRPLIWPDDVSRPTTTGNHCSVSGFHQSGPDTLHQQHDRLQIDSHCHRPNPQHLERGRWLNCSPQQKQLSESGHIYGNATNSSGLETNKKVISDYWTHQQTISSCSDSGGGGLNKSNGWDVTMSAPFDSSSTFETNENENSLQHHHEKAMHEEIGQVPATLEPDSGMNGITALPNSGSAWFSQQGSKKLPNADVWRYAESVGSYIKNDGPGKYKHHMENPSLISESSKNGKFEGNVDGVDNSKRKEKSADGLGSNFDGNDLHSPKSSGQVHQRSSITRKFQNHPMGAHGNEVEPYGNKQVINSQPMNHQHFGGHRGLGHSYLGQSKYGYCDGNYSEMEKGESESLDDNVSISVHPTHIPKTMFSLDRSVGNYALQKTALPRVHETESSDGFAVHSQWNQSSSSQGFGLQLAPPTQGPAMVFSRGSSDSSHTIQHMSETGDKRCTWLATDQTFPPQESSSGENKNNISSTTGQVFDKASQHNVAGNIPQAFTSSFPSSRNQTQNQNMAPVGGQVANTQPASLNQVNECCERAQANQSAMPSTWDMSQLSGTDQICIRDRAIQILAAQAGSQPSVTYGASLHGTPSKVMHNLWTNVSSRKHSTASKIPSQPKQINYCEMTTESMKLGDQSPKEDGNELSAIGVCSAYSNSSVRNVLKESPEQKTLFENVVGAEDAAVTSHLKEPFVKCVASQPSLAVTSSDIEALSRSLRPNKVLNHDFSLLDEVQSMRNVDIDPSNREAKRLKVSDNMVDKQHIDSNHAQQLSYGYDNLVKDVSGNSSSIPSSQPSILCLSEKPHDGLGMNASSQEVIGNDPENSLNVSDSNKPISNRNDHSLMNPHMAPSWFEQYGTFKNVKILPNYDGQKITAAKIMDRPFIIPNQSNGLRFQNSIDQVNSLNDAQLGSPRHNPMPASVASENVCSQLLTPMGEPDLLILRPKKRKTATSELLSWHKELTQGSEQLRDLSAAELLWAQTVNRLIGKVEAGAGVGEDLSVMVKSKRRLVLTTQVMQQLLSPPPAAFLVGDVKLHLESVVYSVSRLTLGEACSSVSWSGCDTLAPGSKNLLPRKQTSSDNVNHYILKVMDFVDRTRKLEDDILRLDSRASILDLRVECQDLERFSVINRFAMFHARGQYDGAETSSSSDSIVHSQRVFPLQFVTAVPLPRNLPDRVQCLSL